MASDLTVKKSAGFDSRFKTSGFNSKVGQSLKKYGTLVNGVAKKKYVPVATSELIKSVRSTVNGTKLDLTSINYRYEDGKTRYDLKNSSVKKNKNKYQWFDRAVEDTEEKRIAIMKEAFDE